MRVIIRPNYDEVSEWVAHYVKRRILDYGPTESRPFVLGLPTGSSPVGTYKKLIEFVKNGELSFQNVITFNMDEYVDIPQEHPQSYHSFMWKNFFSHIDIRPENAHILDGNAKDLKRECKSYEDKIKAAGGIELFLGGIGSDGHVAFNEPGSSLTSRTRVKTLAYETILDNARFFDGDINQVPKMALTVGVGTIMDAREVVIIVSGQHKADALAKCVEQGVNHMYTLSALQLHACGCIVCDEDATMELRVRTVKYFKGLEKVHEELLGQDSHKNTGYQALQEERKRAKTPDVAAPLEVSYSALKPVSRASSNGSVARELKQKPPNSSSSSSSSSSVSTPGKADAGDGKKSKKYLQVPPTPSTPGAPPQQQQQQQQDGDGKKKKKKNKRKHEASADGGDDDGAVSVGSGSAAAAAAADPPALKKPKSVKAPPILRQFS